MSDIETRTVKASISAIKQAVASTGLDTTHGVQGVYRLRLQLGGQDIDWTPQAMNYIEVYEYLDRLLPAFTLSVNDVRGVLTHLTPFDSNWNTVTLTFGNPAFNGSDTSKDATMKFRIYRRRPEGMTQISNFITVSGLLDIPNMFSPRYQRGWVKASIGTILEEMCFGMGFGKINANINMGMGTQMSIVQPNWSNAMFLNYLTRVITSWDEEAAGCLCFTTFEAGLPVLNFTNLTSLLTKPYVCGFTFAKEFDQNLLPIYTFECVDNLEILNMLSVGKQEYNYFDYENGEQVTEEINLSEVGMPSLSQFYAHDEMVGTEGISYGTMDRTTDLIPADRQRTKHKHGYYKRINSLNKMWITSAGNTLVKCGDIVKVVFLDSSRTLTQYQYTGYWMVERIVHHISSTYLTRYLLTRPGVDGGWETTLTPAMRRYGAR